LGPPEREADDAKEVPRKASGVGGDGYKRGGRGEDDAEEPKGGLLDAARSVDETTHEKLEPGAAAQVVLPVRPR
jgi:hypothetical protein